MDAPTMNIDLAGRDHWDQMWAQETFPPDIDPRSVSLWGHRDRLFHRSIANLLSGRRRGLGVVELGCARSAWMPYFGRSGLNIIAPDGTVTNVLNQGTKVFGEGLTILNDEMFQLTWQEHEVFVYDLSGKLKRTMKNPREGWGLTNDGTNLIFSDGSPSFFFADPATFAVRREVKLKSDKPGDIHGLNELELIDGKLFGNVFQTNTILRIDPASGCVEARADLGSLWRSMTDADKKQVTADANNVLNGIAYDKATGLFYLTGKRWRTIFVGRFAAQK